MADEKAGLFSSKKKKKKATEAKIMIEPEEKVMEEVPPPSFDEDTDPGRKVPSTSEKVATAPISTSSFSKTMLDSHPVAKRKYQSIMSQRPVGARKYFKSK